MSSKPQSRWLQVHYSISLLKNSLQYCHHFRDWLPALAFLKIQTLSGLIANYTSVKPLRNQPFKGINKTLIFRVVQSVGMGICERAVVIVVIFARRICEFIAKGCAG